MASKKKAKRTVLYSSAGKKLYAKRDAGGKFKDIQSYQRAHAADLRRTAKDEAPRKAAAKSKADPAKAAAKKAAPKKKAAARKPAAKKAPAKKK
jgi:nucleoid-associated protein YgaU